MKGIGWYVDDKDMAQVSMNLTDYTVTPLHVAYEECLADARELKLPVVGSEIVGLVPLQVNVVNRQYTSIILKLLILYIYIRGVM